MGIYDRDYIRDDLSGRKAPRQAVAGRMAVWSVTTWLIVLCCGVFVIDAIAPAPLWKDVLVTLELQEEATDWQILRHEADEHLPMRGPIVFTRAVVDPATDDVIGIATYQNMPPLMRWLHFSTALGFMKIEFWRLIGFQFLHANLTHLLFNMIGLFFFGPLVEHYLGRKRFLAFYLLAGICGALLYVVLNLGGITAGMLGAHAAIPGLLFEDPRIPLVGASAGVFGVLMAGAYLVPRATVLLFFIIPMQLKTLAYALVGVSIITLIFGGYNAGGEAGHLGGAIAGFYFIRHPHHLHGFFDILGYADPTSHHYRNKGGRAPRGGSRRTARNTAELDRILIKISEKGLGSLTPQERDVLKRETRRE